MQEKLAIIGIGELASGWYPDNTCVGQAVEVIKEAVIDAGISKDDIGAIIFPPPLAEERDEYHLTFSRMVEEMQLQGVITNIQMASWWAAPLMAVQAAKTLLFNNEVDTVLVFHSQHYSGVTDEDIKWFFEKNNAGYHREWERHFGISYENMVALITQRYMHETNATQEQLASVVSTLRKWAQLNPNSRYLEDLSIEEILSSGIKATPLHTLECGVRSDGASAFILTRAENAAVIGRKEPVYLLGEGHAGPPYYSFVQKPDKDFTRLGIDKAADDAIKDAGIKMQDIDVFELYAGYPVFYLMQLEELGLCKRGEAGKAFLEGKAAPGGEISVSTHGGIQQGDTGLGVAMSPIIEGVRQLRDEAGKRQINGAKNALVTGFGNQMMDSHVTILGKELL